MQTLELLKAVFEAVCRSGGQGLRLFKLIAASLCVAMVASCATGPKLIDHSFSINGWYDGWAEKADLLEYRYGDQFNMLQKRNENGLGYNIGVSAAMPVAEFLYVRWRLKDTGEVIEDRVDLRPRLPKDMYRHELTFVIDGRQLYVYIVTQTPITQVLPKPPLRTSLSRHRIAYEIYPTLTAHP
jgi:hypothetical protein